MPSDIITPSDAVRSTTGEVIIPFFAPNGLSEFSFSNVYWYMEQGWESIGQTEDEMTFRIQATGVKNYAFDIVLNPDGPLYTIKFDTPVIAVRYFTDSGGRDNYEVIWGGFVKTIRQKSEGGYQFVQVTATSVKKLFRDINIRGSYCWDGSTVVYRDATPLHLNHGGRPDWTWTTDGIPMPAINADWGLTANSEPPLPADMTSTKATYCTLGMLLRYLGAFYSPPDSGSAFVESAIATARRYYGAIDRLPSVFPFNISWPNTFGTEVDQYIVSNFNNATGQNNTSIGGARKGRDLRFRNGQPLIGNPGEIGVLDTIFAECGGFNYALQYGALGDNADGALNVTLKCVPTRLINASQSLPLFYASGVESEIGPSPMVREIDYLESNGGTYTRMNGVGSSIKIENRIDTTSGSCLKGWIEADFEGFKTDSVQTGNTNEELMNRALKKYPHLFSRFLLKPTYAVETDADFEDYPIANAVRPIWPYLLSYQGADLTTQANDIVPYPIRLEIDAGDGFVDAGIESDGLISWDNGYFEFPILREIGIGRSDTPDNSHRTGIFHWGIDNDNGVTDGAWGGVVGGQLNILLNELRVTVAVPIDATLNYSLKTPADGAIKGDESLYSNAPDSPDAQRFDSQFTRTMVLDLTRLYDLWLRVGSYPVPESAGGTLFADKLSIADAVRSDYALLVQNVNKCLYERNRLQRSGYFGLVGPLLSDVYPLGQQLNSIGPIDNNSDLTSFPLNCCIQRREWTTKNMGDPMRPKWTSGTKIIPI